MRLLFAAALLFTGCAKIITDSHHEVSGDATIHVVVGVDVTACQDLEPAAKAECIAALIELAKAATEAQKDDQQGIGGI